MKSWTFIVLAGLAGAASGAVVFILTAPLIPMIAIRAATGGLAAVIVPILIVMLYYPRLVEPGKDEKKDAD